MPIENLLGMCCGAGRVKTETTKKVRLEGPDDEESGDAQAQEAPQEAEPIVKEEILGENLKRMMVTQVTTTTAVFKMKPVEQGPIADLSLPVERNEEHDKIKQELGGDDFGLGVPTFKAAGDVVFAAAHWQAQTKKHAEEGTGGTQDTAASSLESTPSNVDSKGTA
mmetsp:Transcript_4094/g.9394  ORF Transcript_4094/g.9394 Transcript_4094/m.9394 type:complete len:166 (+) Transcript_4094:76-573(+)|eukprot:CAMPEP_0206454824 /NCGR_PEP_ID=MMETSP0324_2-20121206/21373_1 /ASSEMBLY_ACC=CAM_ASM_000836 /TAXON_ID=2866 /ORGANISM="Crypthecodinium cohnii, Strain Seligo" /LENGTH=165 /DNA_ID=CAMNT_0053925383 /DNA_START=64 /DNA_END=561 /DNA_ORIENTATION=-